MLKVRCLSLIPPFHQRCARRSIAASSRSFDLSTPPHIFALFRKIMYLELAFSGELGTYHSKRSKHIPTQLDRRIGGNTIDGYERTVVGFGCDCFNCSNTNSPILAHPTSSCTTTTQPHKKFDVSVLRVSFAYMLLGSHHFTSEAQ